MSAPWKGSTSYRRTTSDPVRAFQHSSEHFARTFSAGGRPPTPLHAANSAEKKTTRIPISDSETETTIRFPRTRRETRGVKIDKFISSNGKKPQLEVDIEEGRPVDKEQSKFFSIVVSIAAKEMSLHVDHRIASKEHAGRVALDRMKSKVDVNDIDENPLIKDYIMRHIGKINRDRRYRIKKNWLKGNKKKPVDVSDDEWKKTTSKYLSPNYKAKCEKNKEIRNKYVKRLHNTGSRSFAVVRNEISKKELNGETCGEILLFVRTHFKEDASGELDPESIVGVKGKWIDDSSELAYHEMLRIKEANIEAGVEMSEADICNKVLGNENRTDCLIGRGFGPIPERTKSRSGVNHGYMKEVLSKIENVTEEKIGRHKKEMELIQQKHQETIGQHEETIGQLKSQVEELQQTIIRLLGVNVGESSTCTPTGFTIKNGMQSRNNKRSRYLVEHEVESEGSWMDEYRK